MIDTVQLREITARMERMEGALGEMALRVRLLRAKYDIASSHHRILKTMLALLPDTTPNRDALLEQAEDVLLAIYDAANTLSTFAKLELAATDYAVLMALVKTDTQELAAVTPDKIENNLIEGDTPTLVSVYIMPDEAKDKAS